MSWKRLAETPVITAPASALEGNAGGAPTAPRAYGSKFIDPHGTMKGGIGHNFSREAPEPFADAIREVGGATEDDVVTELTAPAD